MQTSWLGPLHTCCPCGAVALTLPTEGPHHLCPPNAVAFSVTDPWSLSLLYTSSVVLDTHFVSYLSVSLTGLGAPFYHVYPMSLAPSTCLVHRMEPISEVRG